jgi:hypothetical protein
VGGALALDAAWLFAAFLIIAVLAAAAIASRRFLLERGGGTVECGLRRGNGPWRLGLASYQREELCWYGALGITTRPDEVFPRRDLTVVSRRPPGQDEAASLGPNMIVIECALVSDSDLSEVNHPPARASESGSGGSEPGLAGLANHPNMVELAMGEAALTGFLSWLEAIPPSSHLGIAL